LFLFIISRYLGIHFNNSGNSESRFIEQTSGIRNFKYIKTFHFFIDMVVLNVYNAFNKQRLYRYHGISSKSMIGEKSEKKIGLDFGSKVATRFFISCVT